MVGSVTGAVRVEKKLNKHDSFFFSLATAFFDPQPHLTYEFYEDDDMYLGWCSNERPAEGMLLREGEGLGYWISSGRSQSRPLSFVCSLFALSKKKTIS